MVQVSLYSDSNIESTMNRILSDTGLDGLEYSVNLAYLPEMGATALQETLPMYFGMALAFVAGYLIIYKINLRAGQPPVLNRHSRWPITWLAAWRGAGTGFYRNFRGRQHSVRQSADFYWFGTLWLAYGYHFLPAPRKTGR